MSNDKIQGIENFNISLLMFPVPKSIACSFFCIMVSFPTRSFVLKIIAYFSLLFNTFYREYHKMHYFKCLGAKKDGLPMKSKTNAAAPLHACSVEPLFLQGEKYSTGVNIPLSKL